ncbi:large ribosomal subunit protein mL42 isoform X3 [Lagenorhynchus albirostris]|uniref:large ribosomal subunit protein mL42 isoform X3 n=1 Tax=Lagenorhynchus albirostris TaxID=27610 RepID=UPI0028E2A5FB|nr:large ribosomal subunit protein mL42 isoform X3 [Lagenorhynchus albirostris]
MAGSRGENSIPRSNFFFLEADFKSSFSSNHLSYHLISILIHHGVGSSKMGHIKKNYLETFISNSNLICKPVHLPLDGTLYCVCHKTTYSSLPDDYNCKVELALTSDGRTIVCYHPSVDIPYEHTKPIPRPDPVQNNEETHDLVLKTRLEEKGIIDVVGN